MSDNFATAFQIEQKNYFCLADLSPFLVHICMIVCPIMIYICRVDIVNLVISSLLYHRYHFRARFYAIK